MIGTRICVYNVNQVFIYSTNSLLLISTWTMDAEISIISWEKLDSKNTLFLLGLVDGRLSLRLNGSSDLTQLPPAAETPIISCTTLESRVARIMAIEGDIFVNVTLLFSSSSFTSHLLMISSISIELEEGIKASLDIWTRMVAEFKTFDGVLFVFWKKLINSFTVHKGIFAY